MEFVAFPNVERVELSRSLANSSGLPADPSVTIEKGPENDFSMQEVAYNVPTTDFRRPLSKLVNDYRKTRSLVD